MAGRLRADARGAAAIEMAIALPILLTLILGIISYGDSFFIAHTVQQAANDAARTAIGGLTADERRELAVNDVNTMLSRGGALSPDMATVTTTDDGSTLEVHISYNASQDPLLRLSFVAAPSTTIERSAAITLGGL